MRKTTEIAQNDREYDKRKLRQICGQLENSLKKHDFKVVLEVEPLQRVYDSKGVVSSVLPFYHVCRWDTHSLQVGYT